MRLFPAVVVPTTVAAVAAGLWLAVAPSIGPGAVESASIPERPMAWAPLDGFERPDWPDPGLWIVPDELTAMWRPSACRARSGTRSLRAFGGPRGAPEASCSQMLPTAALSQIVMRLDLRQARTATRLDLFFDLWLDISPAEGSGVFVHLRMPEPDGSARRVPVFGATAQSGLWVFPMRRLDLIDLEDIRVPGPPIDLRGGLWELEWSAYAPAGVPAGGGAYLDNVSLVWEPDPALPPPTRRPSSTATTTASVTATRRPTATPTPGRSATVAVTPEGRQAFLPILGPAASPAPATATASATATLDVGGKTTATHETVTAPATAVATIGTPGTAVPVVATVYLPVVARGALLGSGPGSD